MARQPNILVFMTDHQRADTVLPEHPSIMPNVEKLGREGVTFAHTYCPMAHCSPSRASFFTGLYPSRHGVWNNVCNEQAISKGLKPGVRLFSDDLGQVGYRLAFSGKWHVSMEEIPADRGWEELLVSSAKGTHHGQSWEQIRENSKRPEPKVRSSGAMLRPGYGEEWLYGVDDAGNSHDELAVNKAIDDIKKYAGEDRPWMVYVGANMPHAPYVVPQKYLDMYKLEDIPLPVSYSDPLTDKPNYYRKLREMRFGQLSELEVRDAIRHFWAMCTYLDELFGKLLQALEETGQSENTLVLYCSDHGDYLGEHGLFHKGVPSFQSAYHVPAVVRWPNGVLKPGRRVDSLVSLADFAPTFSELAGMIPDPTLSGRSLAPFLRGNTPQDWRSYMFTQCNGVENYFTQRIVFDKSYKYVFNGFDYDELYDLRNDPDEMVNLQNHPDYEDVKHELVRHMWQFACEQGDGLGTAGGYIMVSTAPWGPAEAFRKSP